MNAMAFDVMIPLRDALREISLDNDCRVVVLTGAGHGFCSGADLVGGGMVPNISGSEAHEHRPAGAEGARRRDPRHPRHAPAGDRGGQRRRHRWRLLPGGRGRHPHRLRHRVLPRRRASTTGSPSNELGISYLLPRQIGFARAFDILLTGRDVDAEEAERIGLVSQLVPGDQLLERCYELADGDHRVQPVGVELTKQLLWASLDAGSLHAHMNHEGNAQLYVRMTTSNFDEKIAAWKEGRTPVYTDE